MLYKFTYHLNGELRYNTCTTLREAELFFDILISAKCDYIRVITFTRRQHYDKI